MSQQRKPHSNPGPTRVLVTGAGGTVGSAVVDHLLRAGVLVSALDREFSDDCPADRVFEGQATDIEVVAAAAGECEAVIHLAAIPNPALADSPELIATNTVATMVVLDAAGTRGITRVALASSINATGVPFNHHRPLPAYFPLDEHHPAVLDDAYSLSKAHDELTAQMAASRWQMSVTCLRLPFTAGTEGIEDKRILLLSDPDHSVREGWSYLHVDDAARAFHAAIETGEAGAAVMFVAAADTLLPWPTEEALDRYAPGVPRRRRIPGRGSGVDTARAGRRLAFTAEYRHPQPDVVPPWPT